MLIAHQHNSFINTSVELLSRNGKKNVVHWEWKNSIFISRDSSLTAPRKRINEEHVQIFRISSILRVSIDVFFIIYQEAEINVVRHTLDPHRDLIWFDFDLINRDFFLLIDLLCCVFLFWGRKWRFSSAIWRVNIFNHLWFFCMIEYHHHSAVRRSPSYENFIVHHQGRFTQFQQICRFFFIPFVRYKRWL